MRFWDSSALVPLAIREPATETIRQLVREDRELVVWALSGLEVTSALWRRARSGELPATDLRAAAATLAELEAAWHSVVDVTQVANRARRLLGTHALRAADACQLAAALVVSGERPETVAFVTLDERLAEAAEREGFHVLPPLPRPPAISPRVP